MAFVACQSKTEVDTIVHNAVIYTVDSAFTITEAMAVKDGKIVGAEIMLPSSWLNGLVKEGDDLTKLFNSIIKFR